MIFKNLFFKVLIAMLLVSSLPIFSYSRIEGEIVDKDTGLPIEGAWVNLFGCNNPIFKDFCYSESAQETDSKGKFKFEELEAGQYFLVVAHRSYTVYGPAYELKEYLKGGTRLELEEEIPRGLPRTLFANKPERNFILTEGEIKHFVIKLERATELEITSKIKLPSGTDEFKEKVSVFIYDSAGEELFYGFSFRNGFFKSRCLPAFGNVRFKYKTDCYGYVQKTGINLVKGQLQKVELIFDFTSGTTVHGFIKSKQADYRLPRIDISLIPKEGGVDFCEARTDSNGEFLFGGMKPGEYILFISAPTGLLQESLTINENDKIEFVKEI
jgi:protocatechuate 3,4-dioxygenase beta subunit